MELGTSRNLRAFTRKNYEDNLDDEIEGKRTFSVMEKLKDKKFRQMNFASVLPDANDINLKYIQEHGFDSPFVFESPDGLGMRMPSSDFTVEDVKQLVGSRRIVDVIDVNTQQQIEMTMKQFARYYASPKREKIYNVISLEFSHTRLEDYVQTPLLVRQLDWVDNVWPKELIRQQTDSTNNMDDMKYPKVRKYVLMSVKDSYTDFHIDFCGSSVWYHIIRGKKIFWLIPPTKENLAIYENWVLSGKQQDVFLGDQVEKCSLLELASGNTFLMPSGWIHAVYTAEDSLVFGGNFIHNFNIERQFKICDIEERTRVPKKFRYPLYSDIMWYLVERYTTLLEKDLEERLKMGEVAGINGTKADSAGTKRATKRQTSDRRKSAMKEDENKENLEQTDEQVKERRDTRARVKVEVDEKEAETKENVEGRSKSAPEKPWKLVYLASLEVDGLLMVVKRMKAWPKTNAPENIANPGKLLDRLEELLQIQMNNDHALSTSGEQFMKQIMEEENEEEKVRKHKSIRSKPRKAGSSLRRRRTRCRACESCLREDCGECKMCKDMRKFGGPGRMKQTCLMRQCQNPTLPTCATCDICEIRHSDDGETLMECVECASIMHPTCMDPEGYYYIVPDINNCWKCPKCCDEATGEPFLGQRLNAKRPLDQLRPSHAYKRASLLNSSEKSRTLKRKREDGSDESTLSANEVEEEEDEEEESSDSSDEDSAPLSSLAKKSRKEGPLRPPEIPFLPPQEVSPTYVVRPRPVSPPPDSLVLENEAVHVLNREAWLKVFEYLTQPELCTCMCVSRTWNRWCMDKRFWTKIKLSIGRPVIMSALAGIVRRQPLDLDLSHTNITQQQLVWLLKRLPKLRELTLGATTYATVGAFSRVICPPLKVLDLGWSEKITDHVIEDLLKPSNTTRRERAPRPGENASRLRFLTDFRLSGCEVTDVSLRYVKRYLCSLSRLDLSYCVFITDEGIASLMDSDSSFHKNVKELNLTGCTNVTDSCLEALKKAENLAKIDLRKCELVNSKACDEFVEFRGAAFVVLSH